MLGGMDISAAATGTATVPWLVLGVVLGVLLVLLTGLTAALVLRLTAPTPPPDEPVVPGDYRDDDLPGFLETPPGSGAAAPQAGWAALTTTAAGPAADPPPPARGRRDTVVVLTSMAVTALLLIGAAAAVAATTRPHGRSGQDRPADTAARGAGDVEARLTFGGVVLEPRAVGVTATYPVVQVTSDGGVARAHVEFPTFNCLSAAAPADPVAAGCTPSLTEYADLTSPDLVVDREEAALRVTGRVPTELRPNGGGAVPTGRVYELRISVAAADGPSVRGWQPAEGVLELGTGRADTVDEPGVSVLRSGP
jgi:hypothetical protein